MIINLILIRLELMFPPHGLIACIPKLAFICKCDFNNNFIDISIIVNQSSIIILEGYVLMQVNQM